MTEERTVPLIPIDLLSVARRRYGYLLAGTLVGMFAAFIYGSGQDVVYQSESEVLVVQKDANLVSHTVEAVFGEEILATHMHIMLSSRIIRDAVREDQLLDMKSLAELATLEAAEAGATVVAASSPPASTGDSTGTSDQAVEDAAVDYIIANLDVKHGGEGRAKGAQVLHLSFRHAEPSECKEILRAVVASYQRFVNETVYGADDEAARLISIASQELDDKVREHEESYLTFREQAPILWSREGSAINPHEVRLAELEAELSRVRFRRTEAASRLDVVETYLASPVSKELSDELPNLSMIDSADIERLSFLVGAIGHQKHSNRNLRAYVGLLKHDLSDLDRREKSIIQSSEEERELAQKLVKTVLQEENLRRSRDRAQSLYDSVVDRLNEINLLKDHGGFISEVISPARAGQQAWPNIPLVTVLGGLLGLLLGAGFGAVAELKDDSFQSSDEIERELRVPVLACLKPQTPSREKRIAGYDERLTTVHQPDSAGAESIRVLRAVLYSGVDERSVMQVTSPSADSGTTTTTANLAVSIANSGRRVLLVDADLRRPRIHKLFGFDNAVGLSSILLDQAGEEAIRHSQLPDLDILTSGPIIESPSELLMKSSFRPLLDVLRQDYDYVLVDCPPVLGTSDSLSIASQVDCTLMNLSGSKNNSGATAKLALDRLTAAGASVLGVIVSQSTWTQSSSNVDWMIPTHHERRLQSELFPGHSRGNGRVHDKESIGASQ